MRAFILLALAVAHGAAHAQKCESIRDPAGYTYVECDPEKIKAGREKEAEAARNAPPPAKPGHLQTVEEFAANMAVISAKNEEERKVAAAKAALVEAEQAKARPAAPAEAQAPKRVAQTPSPAKPEPSKAKTETPKPAPATTGYWQAQVDENKMDKTARLVMFLDGSEPYPNRIIAKAPSLVIRCENGKVEFYVNARTHISGPGDDLHSHRFRVRIDDGKPEVLIGSKATSSDAVFLPRAAHYVSRLRFAKELMVEVTPYTYAPATSTFLVGGLDQHKALMDKHCRLK